jgi:hypothetical protein
MRPTAHARRVARPVRTADPEDELWGGATVCADFTYHSKSSDHRPTVEVRLLYDHDHLWVRYDVADRYVLGRTTESNGPVYTDSAVEIFVSPDGERYTNIEMNCVGTMLVGSIDGNRRASTDTPLEDPALWERRIERWTSLSGRADEMAHEVEGALAWTAVIKIPFDLVSQWHGCARPAPSAPDAPGTIWRVGLFKCADASSHPHWGAWAPIGEVLDFHLPEFFGNLLFDA